LHLKIRKCIFILYVTASPIKRSCMIRVLVADSNLDSHKLINDIVQINFRNVVIDQAHNCESFAEKVEGAKPQYNLIFYSIRMENEDGRNKLSEMIQKNPDLRKRMILMAESKDTPLPNALNLIPIVTKPYSLDYFGEVIKKTCVN